MERKFRSIKDAIIGLIVFPVVFFGVIYFFTDSRQEIRKRAEDQLIRENLTGVVVRKYLDKQDHNTMTLAIKQESGNIVLHTFDFDESGFFDFVSEGDSLRKNEGDSVIFVFCENKKATFTFTQ